MDREFEFHMRLTESEYTALREKAGNAGVSRAVFLRNLFMDRPVADRETAEQLRALTVEISRIGNNINQIAHRWNESGADYRDIEPVHKMLGEIARKLQEVRHHCYHQN